jgi:hypothetical protein
MLSFPLENLLELHYALSNDHAVDDRAKWPCAQQLLESRRRPTAEEADRAVRVVEPDVSDDESPPIDPYEGAAKAGGMDPYEGALPGRRRS